MSRYIIIKVPDDISDINGLLLTDGLDHFFEEHKEDYGKGYDFQWYDGGLKTKKEFFV